MSEQEANKHIISIVGSKGGGGKTLTSHILCHGLSLLGYASILITTDPDRNALEDRHRRYTTFGAQDDATFGKVISHFQSADINRTSIMVLDGGASRLKADVIHAALSSLIILPFLTDKEDWDLAISNTETLRENLTKDDFERVRLLPSRYPTNLYALARNVRRTNEMFTEELRSMMLNPVEDQSALQIFKETSIEQSQITSEMNNSCRKLAVNILLELGEDPFQYKSPRRF